MCKNTEHHGRSSAVRVSKPDQLCNAFDLFPVDLGHPKGALFTFLYPGSGGLCSALDVRSGALPLGLKSLGSKYKYDVNDLSSRGRDQMAATAAVKTSSVVERRRALLRLCTLVLDLVICILEGWTVMTMS